MNRLILIGNGFDLAHGLKTGYNDFIIWYLKNTFDKVERDKPFEDNLIKVKKTYIIYPKGINNTSDYIDHCYTKGLNSITAEYLNTDDHGNQYPNPFDVEIKSNLFAVLLSKCSYTTWVEIENDFYEMLKNILRERTDLRESNLANLNNSLEEIIKYLKEYLLDIKPSHRHDGYSEIFESPILEKDIVSGLSKNETPEQTLILNFNYTNTVEEYFKPSSFVLQPKKFKINYIHGELTNKENPLIFGFGDELDSEYTAMEHEKLKGFFKFIKSFWYFKTSNYHDLLRFIEINDYQIFIIGHSCGLSDRTMLSMLFEHPNCKSMKIFYYENEEGYNNYEDLTLEISRHFKDKLKMRRVIVSKNNSTPMPQIKP